MFIAEDTARTIVSEMKAVTGRDINLMDGSGTILASTDPDRVGRRHAGAEQLLRQGLEKLVVRQDDPDAGTRRGVNLPIHMDGRTVGVIGITGAPEQVEPLGSVIKRMTEILLRESRRQEQEALLEDARQCFIESWLFSDHADPGDLELRGRLLDIDTTQAWTVVILEVTAPQEAAGTPEDLREMRNARFLKHIQPYLREEEGALCAVVNQRILLMYHSRGRHALLASIDRLRSELEAAFSARICGGVSAQGRRGVEVRRGYQEARTACLAARSGGGILFYNQVSLEFLARSIPSAIRQDLFQQVFGGCPERERQELLETVRLYFQYDGQVERMAQALYVHKNTCHYRLQKLKEKTGYSVHNPRESVLLCLCSLFDRLEET